MTDLHDPPDSARSASPPVPPVFEHPEGDLQPPSAWDRFRTMRVPMIALGFLVFLAIVAILAPWLTPQDPDKRNIAVDTILQGPGREFWLGSDDVGRDVLSRLMVATRVMWVAVIESVGIAVIVGVPVGLLNGYFGGWVDRTLGRVVDLLIALPAALVAFAAVALFGPGLTVSMFAVGLVFSTNFARLTRGVVMEAKEELYVDAACAGGVPTRTVLFREILPNIGAPLIVQASITAAAALLIEAGLSFLGIGLPVGEASWGGMLSEARLFQNQQAFLPFPPGVALALAVLAFNLVGDGVRDALTPGGLSSKLESLPSDVVPGSAMPGDVVPSGAAIGVVTPRAGFGDERVPVLAVSDLSVAYRSDNGGLLTVTDDVSLVLHRGETLGLVGESGSGKTTVALAAMGLLPMPGRVTSGSIRVDGMELVGASERQLASVRGSKIAMVFQEPFAALNPAFKIGDQVTEALRANEGWGRKRARAHAIELLGRVGIPNPSRRVDDYPHQFSGGMAQRAVIAMALANEPDVLVADEPSTALDVTVQAQVLDLLVDLQEERGMAVLFITHDLGVVADVADHVAVMYAGQIVESGTVDRVLHSPEHPYTAALLATLPQVEHRAARLPTIEGLVPQPFAWPTGCRFADRCAHVVPACRENPVLLGAGPHRARCLRSDEIDLEGAS